MKVLQQQVQTNSPPSVGSSAIAFECCGARIMLGSTDHQVLQDLIPLLPPGSSAIAPNKVDATLFIQKRPQHGLYCIQDSHEIPRGELAYRTLEELASEFHFIVSVFARPYLFVHAGVVAWCGHAIILPGHSMTGKSTLVSALVDYGATYYSDEYAVIDRHGRIHPYRKSLALRTRGGVSRRFETVPISETAPHAESSVASLVASLTYRANSTWNPRNLTPAETVLTLFKNTVAAKARGQFALRALSHVARRATCIKGLRPEASVAAAALIKFATESSRASGPGGFASI